MDRFFYDLECYLKRQAPVTRNRFIKVCIGTMAAFVAGNALLKSAFAKETVSTGRRAKDIKGNYDIVAAEGADPYRNTVRVVEEMGGMGRFVKKGGVVVIKPNIGWDRTPEQAANTNPRVVAALVEMSLQAGAKRVNVFDITCNNERLCYENSGIYKAAKDSGANVYFADQWNVVQAHFPFESPMEEWPVLSDAVECDTFINVPVLKHHSLAGLTMSMKNLMGVCGGRRGLIHINLGRKLVDLSRFINPELTIIDATRVLLRHGPTGGNLEDVLVMNKVLAATDPTLADSYAAYLLKKDPMSIASIKEAAAQNYGVFDLSKAKIKSVKT